MAETATGRGGGEFPLEAVLSVFEERADPARPLTANDIMEALGCCRRTAHNKLETLVEQDALATRKVGARGRVWWVPMDGSRQPTAASTGDREQGSHTGDREPAVETGIATADLPGSDAEVARRREALRAAYDYLSENPNATETEFLTEVFPEYPAGFKTADRWWAVIRPALEDLPNVDVEEEREHVWRFAGG